MVSMNVIPDTVAHIPETETLKPIANTNPIQVFIIAYMADKISVNRKSFVTRHALAAGAAKKEMVRIAPTEENAKTAVKETMVIKA